MALLLAIQRPHQPDVNTYIHAYMRGERAMQHTRTLPGRPTPRRCPLQRAWVPRHRVHAVPVQPAAPVRPKLLKKVPRGRRPQVQMRLGLQGGGSCGPGWVVLAAPQPQPHAGSARRRTREHTGGQRRRGNAAPARPLPGRAQVEIRRTSYAGGAQQQRQDGGEHAGVLFEASGRAARHRICAVQVAHPLTRKPLCCPGGRAGWGGGGRGRATLVGGLRCATTQPALWRLSGTGRCQERSGLA